MLDQDAFTEMVRGFVELYRVGIKVFDNAGTKLADVKINSPEFCGYVFGFPEGRRMCTATVGRVKDGPITCVHGARKPFLDDDPSLSPEHIVTVPCFTGLRYLVAPIVWEGDDIGRVVFGPFMPVDLQTFPPESLTKISPNLDLSTLKNLVDVVRRAPEATIVRVLLHFGTLLQTMLFAGQKWFLTSQMHIEGTLEHNRELEDRAQRLQEANIRLQELDRLKSSFLATVSHELRTPLTSIIGYSEMLSEGMAGTLNTEQAQYIQTITEKGETLLKLISSILDLSQIEAGRVRLSFAQMDAIEVVRSSITSLTPQAQRKQIEITMTFPAPSLRVTGDYDRLRQVVTNLLTNAVKFTPQGGKVSVTVNGINLQPELNVEGYRITVEDNGRGIPEEQLDRIFHSFYQVDSSSTREHGGAGLGLAIVKSFVEGHGGRVEVSSEVGKWSRFTIILPSSPSFSSQVHIAPPVTTTALESSEADRF